VPGALAGYTSLTCGAVPCHWAGRGHLQWWHRPSSTSRGSVSYARCDAIPLRRMQPPTEPPSAGPSHLLLAGQCHAVAPDVVTYSAALGPAAPAGVTSCSRDAPPCQYAGCSPRPRYHLRLVRAMRSHAIVTEVATYNAAISFGKGGSSTSRPCISYYGAVPCHCAGCGRLRCCHQRARKCQPRWPALHRLLAGQSRAIGPDVVTYSAGTGPAAPAGVASRIREVTPYHCAECSPLQCRHQLGPHLSYWRGHAMPLRRMWSPTVLP